MTPKFLIFWILSVSPVFAILDLDGNSVSDLWQRLYPEAVLDGLHDTDGDGFSDLDEAIAGSNPEVQKI